jgi:hypothetical protein
MASVKAGHVVKPTGWQLRGSRDAALVVGVIAVDQRHEWGQRHITSQAAGLALGFQLICELLARDLGKALRPPCRSLCFGL